MNSEFCDAPWSVCAARVHVAVYVHFVHFVHFCAFGTFLYICTCRCTVHTVRVTSTAYLYIATFVSSIKWPKVTTLGNSTASTRKNCIPIKLIPVVVLQIVQMIRRWESTGMSERVVSTNFIHSRRTASFFGNSKNLNSGYGSDNSAARGEFVESSHKLVRNRPESLAK